MKKIDLVTIAFTGELKMLQLQARSIRLYADPELIGTIFIIIHDNDQKTFMRFFLKNIKNEYGNLSDKVCILDYKTLTNHKIDTPDWSSQQALKLLVARLVTTPDYLILDSKNHLIRPLTIGRLYDERGKMRMPLSYFHKPYKEHFDYACQYFGMHKIPETTLSLPTITPFLMNTGITQNLVQAILEKEEKPFHTLFSGKTPFTEFYLYFAYVLASGYSLQDLYVHTHPIGATHFINSLSSDQRIAYLNACLLEDSTYVMGVHRKLIQEMSSTLRENITQDWLHFNLVQTAKEAEYFLTPEPRITAEPAVSIIKNIIEKLHQLIKS